MDHQIPVLVVVARPVWARHLQTGWVQTATQAFRRRAWEGWAESAQEHRHRAWAEPAKSVYCRLFFAGSARQEAHPPPPFGARPDHQQSAGAFSRFESAPIRYLQPACHRQELAANPVWRWVREAVANLQEVWRLQMVAVDSGLDRRLVDPVNLVLPTGDRPFSFCQTPCRRTLSSLVRLQTRGLVHPKGANLLWQAAWGLASGHHSLRPGVGATSEGSAFRLFPRSIRGVWVEPAM